MCPDVDPVDPSVEILWWSRLLLRLVLNAEAARITVDSLDDRAVGIHGARLEKCIEVVGLELDVVDEQLEALAVDGLCTQHADRTDLTDGAAEVDLVATAGSSVEVIEGAEAPRRA